MKLEKKPMYGTGDIVKLNLNEIIGIIQSSNQTENSIKYNVQWDNTHTGVVPEEDISLASKDDIYKDIKIADKQIDYWVDRIKELNQYLKKVEEREK